MDNGSPSSTGAGAGLRARLRRGILRALASPRAPLWISALVVLLLGLPSLGGGLALDDLMLVDHLDRGDSLFALFELGPQSPEDALAGRSAGAYPWWTSEALRVRFLRPVAALTHALDHALWPDAPWLMHAHSVAWYLLLVALVAALYRELLVGRDDDARRDAAALPGLALLIFAIDDAHAANVGWIAARGGLVGACLAALTLLLYARARARGRAPGPLGLLTLALALLASESSLAALGYLLAYALTLDAGPSWRARLLPLLPFVLVALAWLAVYGALGYGAAGCGLYVDPLREPARFMSWSFGHGALLIAAQLGLPMIVELLGFVPGARGPAIAIAVLGLALVVLVLRPLLRRDARARFWGLGMLLAAAAHGGAVPQERYLLLIGLGGAAIVALALHDLLTRAPVGRLARALAWIWLALHVVLPPLLAAPRAQGVALLHGSLARAVAAVPAEGARPVILLNAPGDMVPLYAPALRRRAGGDPAPLHVLHAGASPVVVERVAPDALRVDAHWLAAPGDRVFRDRVHPLAAGARASLSGLELQVLEVSSDGAPRRVMIHMSPETDVIWMIWRGGAPREWTPPPVGEPRELAPAAWDFAS